MKGLHFESRGEGNYYKLILHVGQLYIPISDDVIEVLKQHQSDTSDRFLSIFLEKVGYSTYLKEIIQKELTQSGDIPAQVNTLQEFLKAL